MGLAKLREVQRLVSSKSPDSPIPVLSGDTPTRDHIRSYFLATIVELVELMNELNWKPWTVGERPLNNDRIIDEFADVLAFLGVLVVFLDSLGISVASLAIGYSEKTDRNLERFFRQQTGKTEDVDTGVGV
jgi:hypothetical protein